MPKLSEAKKRANEKWNKENMNKLYDHAHILMPKGQKAEYQAHAATMSESLNAFINRAIEGQIERDKPSG